MPAQGRTQVPPPTPHTQTQAGIVRGGLTVLSIGSADCPHCQRSWQGWAKAGSATEAPSFSDRGAALSPPTSHLSLSVSGRGPAQPAPLNTCHVPTISSHRESDSEPLAGAALINRRLVRGLCGALILRWADLRTEGPTNVGERVRLRAGRLMPGKGTCPLLQNADWFSGSSWYIYITGQEQSGWKLICAGRGHEHGTCRAHCVNKQILRSCPPAWLEEDTGWNQHLWNRG